MADRRTIKAKDIVNDLRSGMTNVELMEKYRLSAKGLRSIFAKLTNAKAVNERELAGRVPLVDDTVNLGQMRCLPRHYLLFRLPVSDTNNLATEGRVRDITERGLQTVGIPAKPGETKELRVQAGELVNVPTVVFEAECKWSRPETQNGQCVAGFQISDISPESLAELRELIQALTLGNLMAP